MSKINGRNKGHAFERVVAEIWREAGWEKCVTSRSESKNLDDMGIDLCYTEPFIVQCKAVEALNVHKALGQMPEIEGTYKALFSKKNRQGTVVVLDIADFFELLGMLRAAGVLN